MLHRVRMKHTDENPSRKVQSIIVKFKSWKSHEEFNSVSTSVFENVSD